MVVVWENIRSVHDMPDASVYFIHILNELFYLRSSWLGSLSATAASGACFITACLKR